MLLLQAYADYCVLIKTRDMPASESCACQGGHNDPVLIFQGFHKEVPETGQLKQQNHTSSRPWGLEGQDQGVSRAGFCQGLSPWFADGHLQPASSRGLPSVRVVS